MKTLYKLSFPIIIAMILWLSLPGCKSHVSIDVSNLTDTAKSPDISVEVKKEKELTEQQAVQKVQNYLAQQNEVVTVSMPYTDWETVRKACMQYDVDTDPNKDEPSLCKCKPDGSPYGYKMVQEATTKCCQTKTVSANTLRGQWVATYSETSDEWKVELEASDVKEAFDWFVGDKNGSVTKSEQGTNSDSRVDTMKR